MNFDDLKHYSHSFMYTVQQLPKDGELLFISRGAPEPFLYNKHHSWQILGERSLFCDCKGRLGLVVGPVRSWSNATGIMLPGKTRLLEICTIHAGKPQKYIGCTKILVDGMLIPELNYLPEGIRY